MARSRSATVAVTAAVAVLLVLPVACDRPGQDGAEAVRRSYETWTDYVQATAGDGMATNRIVFVGIDGACWNIIDPLIDEGILPAFARLKADGASGVLRSTACYVSPPAWTTMMTGYRPEHSGVFTFGIWDDDRREFVNITSKDVVVPSVWDVSSFMRRPTAVANVPVTYPVRAVDGIMVSGLLTPSSLAERHSQTVLFTRAGERESRRYPSHSPVLRASVDYSATRFDIFLTDSQDDDRRGYDVAYVGVATADTITAAGFLVSHYSDWLPIQYEYEGQSERAWCKLLVLPADAPDEYTVATSSVFFDAGDTDVEFTYPQALQAELKQRFDHYLPSKFVTRYIVPSLTDEHVAYASFFRGYGDWDLFAYVFTQTDNIQHLDGVSPITKLVYQSIDRYLQGVMDDLPDDTILMIASDHGFKAYEYSVDLNQLFESMGLLAYKDDAEIDYDRTLAFHNLWSVYFNKKLLTRAELEKRGIAVETRQEPRDALMAHLARATPPVPIPGDAQPLTLVLSPFPDTEFDSAPDMIVQGTYTNTMVEFWNLARPGDTIVRALGTGETWNHTREGMYAFYGKGVRAGFAGPVEDIQDIAPTMLCLMGLPLAADMDGRVIRSVFASDAVPGPADVVKNYGEVYRPSATDEDRDPLEKKLRSLGYIR